jgi:YnbE-like lipoprotein
MKSLSLLPLATLVALTAGCVQLAAPEKPIEINLNINVKQEVIVRLQKDAQDLIDKNPELFPQ